MKLLLKALVPVSIFFSVECSAQPGDLTHPAHRSENNIITYGETKFTKREPIVIFDGVNLTSSILKTIDVGTIDKNSFRITRDSIFDVNHVLKYQGKVELSSVYTLNSGLKYIKEKTNNWVAEHPLTVFYLNGELLTNDSDKLNKLSAIKISDIKSITVFKPEEAKLKYGQTAENGAVIIISE